ncbi:MAG: periplasmic heavy metal sensor [Alphaproteobacteria bacterium]|nr:MAG: periplasmic heavy metal sensor [Alphaproteobacteria bacterium]
MTKNNWLTYYASLGLNILLVGFLLGRAIYHPPHGPFPGLRDGGPISELSGQMSDQGRALMRETFADIHDIHKNGREDIENARKAIAEAIGAPDWNAAALDKAEERMQSLMDENMKKSRARMRALLEKLTPQERKIIADHMRDGPPPPPPIP